MTKYTYENFRKIDAKLNTLAEDTPSFHENLATLFDVGNRLLVDSDVKLYRDISYRLRFWRPFKDAESTSPKAKTNNVVPFYTCKDTAALSPNLASLLAWEKNLPRLNFVYMRYFDNAFGEPQDVPKPPFDKFLKECQEFIQQLIGKTVTRRQNTMIPEDRLGHIDSLDYAVRQLLRFELLAAEPATITPQRIENTAFYQLGSVEWMGVVVPRKLATIFTDENPGLEPVATEDLDQPPSRLTATTFDSPAPTTSQLLEFCYNNNLAVTTRAGTAAEDLIEYAGQNDHRLYELKYRRADSSEEIVKLLFSRLNQAGTDPELRVSEDIAFLDWGVARQAVRNIEHLATVFPVRLDSPAAAGYFVPEGDTQFREMIKSATINAFTINGEWRDDFRTKMERFGVVLGHCPTSDDLVQSSDQRKEN